MPNALLLRLIFLRGTFRSNCCQPPVTSLRDAAPAHCPPICVALASPSQSFHFKYITPEVGLALAALLVMVGGGPVEFGPSNRGAVWLPVIICNLAKLHARRMGSPSLGRVLQRLGRIDDRPWCCVFGSCAHKGRLSQRLFASMRRIGKAVPLTEGERGQTESEHSEAVRNRG